MKIYAKLEDIQLDGEGNIFIAISKSTRDIDRVRNIIDTLKKLKGVEVIVRIDVAHEDWEARVMERDEDSTSYEARLGE